MAEETQPQIELTYQDGSKKAVLPQQFFDALLASSRVVEAHISLEEGRQRQCAVERHPRHQLGVDVVTRLRAGLPDAVVGCAGAVDGLVDEFAQRATGDGLSHGPIGIDRWTQQIQVDGFPEFVQGHANAGSTTKQDAVAAQKSGIQAAQDGVDCLMDRANES